MSSCAGLVGKALMVVVTDGTACSEAINGAFVLLVPKGAL